MSIASPDRRWPLTSSSCPINRGALPRKIALPPSGAQVTSGLAGSSAPCSGSTASRLSQVISAAAANCVVGSSDWRVANSTSRTFVRSSAASIEFAGFAGAVASSFGASPSDLDSSSGTGWSGFCSLKASIARFCVSFMSLYRPSTRLVASSFDRTPTETQSSAVFLTTSPKAASSGPCVGCSTGRKNSCEVCPRERASWESSPGTVMTRVSPSVTT